MPTTSPSRLSLLAAMLVVLLSACSTIAPPAGQDEASPRESLPVVVDDETVAIQPVAKPARQARPARSATTPTARRTSPTAARSSAPRSPSLAPAAVADEFGPPDREAGVVLQDVDGDQGGDTLKLVGPEPKLERLASFANRPYRLRGRLYRPMTEIKPFRQRGIASWYGRPFHGRKTAIGERYNMHAMTAAHPTLPLPSYVKVRNLTNGSAVIVRVNDRGPFKHERVIDVSYAAAQHLGFVEGGITAVEIDLIVLEPAGVPSASPVADSRN